MRTMLLAMSLVALFLTAVPNGQQEKEQILERFLSKKQESLREYQATRDLKATNQKVKLSGSVRAETRLEEKNFNYTITMEEGSGYIRNKILRKVLDEEKEMVEKTDPDKISFSTRTTSLIKSRN